MTTSQATVYYKTGAGLEEMQSRQAGLNPRVRQLLILIDGKRNVLELQKLMAFAELEEFVSLLELKGLIAQDVRAATPDAVAGAVPGVSNVSGLALAPRAAATSPGFPPAIATTGLALPDADTDVAVASALPVAAPVAEDQVMRDRQNLASLLADAVGPMSDEICSRIRRAERPGELSELFVASLTIVELMSGRKAADRLVEKLKNLGWEY